MAKRSRKKNKKATMIYLKFIILGIFFIFILFFVFNRSMYFFNHAEMFKIKEVIREPSLQFIESRSLTRLKGQSIFSVNLRAVQKQLQSRYPEVDRLRIIRKFPNRIYIVAQKREPFAYLTLEKKDVLLDKEGVVLSVNALPDQKLPLVRGVRTNQTIVPGESLGLRQINVALEIIKTVEKNEYLTKHKIESIDVSNLSKIDLFFLDTFKVIIDQGRVSQKINKLGILVSQGNLDVKTINYIDLRFKEPILGQK